MQEVWQMDGREEALCSEIAFWRQQIGETGVHPGSPVYQRMLKALQLAEYKLSLLRTDTDVTGQQYLAH